MSTRSFHSLFMVASCAGAALGCYLVSLRVASERAAVEAVESKIVAVQRDMRVLQTEIGTRGRLAQLERWNVKVLALSAPSADQFLQGGFELARLTQPDKPELGAPVVLAAAPATDDAKPEIGARGNDDSGARASVRPNKLLHEASLKTETREVPANTTVSQGTDQGSGQGSGQGAGTPRPGVKKSIAQPVTAAKPARRPSMDKPGLAAAKPNVKATPKVAAKKSVDKTQLASAQPVTKPVRIAKTDPLAPLPETRAAKPTKD